MTQTQDAITPDELRWAAERVAPVDLDPDSVAAVVALWKEMQEPVAAIRAHPTAATRSTFDFWAWVVRASAERSGEEGAGSLPPEGAVPEGWLTAAGLVRAYRDGERSPVDAARTCLERIAARDGEIRSVVSLAPDVIERAEDAARRLERGERHPLLGVPFGVKDVADREGMRTTGGCRGWPSEPATRTAPVIARLEEAGAVLVAKLSTPELNCGNPMNELLGAVANPHDHSRWTGGSSAGPAAAVAAGLLPLAIGEDTAGSIRLPAAHCGVVGLRPTLGRVPRAECIPVAWSMDQAGPMASTVRDAALGMQAIAAHDPADPLSLAIPAPDYTARLGSDVAGLRVGVVRNWFLDLIDGAVRAAFEEALERLRTLGCQVLDVMLPAAARTSAATWVVIRSEFSAFLQARPEVLAACELETRRRAALGLLSTAVDYIAAQRYRAEAQLEFEQVCRDVDLVVTPAAPSTAGYFVGDEARIDIDGQSYPWNTSARTSAHFGYIGCPALVVPTGVSAADGMPVALQLAGMPDSEPLLLQVGDALEQAVRRAGTVPVVRGA